MAKDRTRHARRREPGSRQESPLDGAAQETAQALVDIADVVATLLDGLSYEMAVTVSDCAEMYRRLTNERY